MMYMTLGLGKRTCKYSRTVEGFKLDVNISQCENRNIRIGLEFYLEAAHQIIQKQDSKQGADTHKYVHQRDKEQVNAHQCRATWILQKNIPTFEEYMKNGVFDIAVLPLILITKLELCNGFALSDLGSISAFDELCSWNIRLFDDLTEEENDDGEYVSAVTCYAKENPECTMKEVIENIRVIHTESSKKIIQQYFETPREDELKLKTIAIEITRSILFEYSHGDDFDKTNIPWINQVNLIFFEHIP